MTREVEFRAKSTFDDHWVYGFYVEREGYTKGMIYNRAGLGSDVDPKTRGEFTGFTDKKGIKIYEGDVVRQVMPSQEVWFGVIVFARGAFRINETPTEDNAKIYNKELIGELCEVVGNNIENPSLLD